VVTRADVLLRVVERGNSLEELFLSGRTGNWASRYWSYLVITLAALIFWCQKLGGLPVGAAQAAGFIDGQLALTFVLMGIVF